MLCLVVCTERTRKPLLLNDVWDLHSNFGFIYVFNVSEISVCSNPFDLVSHSIVCIE